ncbi:MAG: hypothetical protein AB1735_03935 [Pseudomonadota bacterium]|jgi:hypothetical protein
MNRTKPVPNMQAAQLDGSLVAVLERYRLLGYHVDTDAARAQAWDPQARTIGVAALHQLLAAYWPGVELRVLPFRSVFTADYRATRLSVHLDQQGRIDRILVG